MSNRKSNSKKKRGALLSAIVIIVIALIYACVYLWLLVTDAMPAGFIIALTVITIIIIAGIVVALRERFKEIEGGEEDDALNY